MFIANLKEFLQIQRKVSIRGNSHLSGKDAKEGVGNLFWIGAGYVIWKQPAGRSMVTICYNHAQEPRIGIQC